MRVHSSNCFGWEFKPSRQYNLKRSAPLRSPFFRFAAPPSLKISRGVFKPRGNGAASCLQKRILFELYFLCYIWSSAVSSSQSGRMNIFIGNFSSLIPVSCSSTPCSPATYRTGTPVRADNWSIISFPKYMSSASVLRAILVLLMK